MEQEKVRIIRNFRATKYEMDPPNGGVGHDKIVAELVEKIRAAIENDLTKSPMEIPPDGYAVTIQRFTKKC